MTIESKESDPYLLTEKWIAEEGAAPLFGVLATVDTDNQPYTRTISIREINQDGVLFFTQKGSKKVQHIKENPAVSLTLYLPVNKRQITFRGIVKALSDEDNDRYWKTYPKESQLRFLVYGPKSGEEIAGHEQMDQELEELRKEYQGREPDRPDAYVGNRIEPDTFEYYQLNADRISDSYLIRRNNENWDFLRVVP